MQFLQNIDPEMVARMQPVTGEDEVPPALTDAKADQAAKAVLTQTDHTKCWSCSKKVGLLGFKCYCQKTFCGKHRYDEQHTCPFDYKAANKANLKNNLKPCEGTSLKNKL